MSATPTPSAAAPPAVANPATEASTLNVYKVGDAIAACPTPFIAFEYYPPRTEEGVKNLHARIERMSAHKPLYIDVTWGAGGSTSDLTMDLCVDAQNKYGVVSNMHLTCTNMPREKLDIALSQAKEHNVRNILALRGDAPVGQVDWKPVDSGFSCALDLVKHIKTIDNDDFFDIAVAGYPEGHPDNIKLVEAGTELSEAEKGRVVDLEGEQYVCSDAAYEVEMTYLKEKVDAGAQVIVSQMFFDVEVFISFVKACRAKGINCQIVPGIICVTAYAGWKKMVKFCKSRVPKAMEEKMESIKDDAEQVKAYGIEFGTKLCKDLLESGAPGVHFYTLNLEKCVDGILKNLKMGSFAEPAVTSPLSVLESTAERAVGGVAAAAAGVAEKVKEAVEGVAEKVLEGAAAVTPQVN